MKALQKTLLSRHFKEIVAFHGRKLQAFQWPVAKQEFNPDDKKNHLYCNKDTKFFFRLDENVAFHNNCVSQIRNGAVLGRCDRVVRHEIRDILAQYGAKVLVLVEDYNAGINKLLARFFLEETSYWQIKLVCPIQGVRLNKANLLNVRIRNFNPQKDIDTYTAYYNKVFNFLGVDVDRKFVEGIVDRVSFDSKGYFLAEVNNEVVGFCAIEKEPWGNKSTHFGYIYQIGVNEEFRGKGLADMLLAKGLEYAYQAGITRLGVGVVARNESAVRFFEKRGFAVAFEIRGIMIETTEKRSLA